MPISRARRGGLRSPLHAKVTSAVAWQDANTGNRIVGSARSILNQRISQEADGSVGPNGTIAQNLLGRITQTIDASTSATGIIEQRLGGIVMGSEGDAQADIIHQNLFRLKMHATGGMESFGTASSNMSFARITTDSHGVVSAKGTIPMNLGVKFNDLAGTTVLWRLSMSAEGLVARARGQIAQTLGTVRQAAAGSTKTEGAVIQTLGGITQHAEGYEPTDTDLFGSISTTLGFRVTIDADHFKFVPVETEVDGYVSPVGEMASTLRRVTQSASGYQSPITGSSASTLNSRIRQDAGAVESIIGRMDDGQVLFPVHQSASGEIINDGAIRSTLFGPTQRADGWAQIIASSSMTLLGITNSGGGGQTIPGVVAQTLFRPTQSVVGGTKVEGHVGQTLFRITQIAVAPPSVTLTTILAAEALLSKDDWTDTIAAVAGAVPSYSQIAAVKALRF